MTQLQEVTNGIRYIGMNALLSITERYLIPIQIINLISDIFQEAYKMHASQLDSNLTGEYWFDHSMRDIIQPLINGCDGIRSIINGLIEQRSGLTSWSG